MSGQSQPERAPLLTAYAALVYAFLYFPIVVLIVYSFSGSVSEVSLLTVGHSTGIATSSATLICGLPF